MVFDGWPEQGEVDEKHEKNDEGCCGCKLVFSDYIEIKKRTFSDVLFLCLSGYPALLVPEFRT